MRKRIVAYLLIAAAIAVPAAAAYALVMAPPPGPVRIVQSDAVFVGRVTAIEPTDIEATQYPGAKQTVKYSIAVVQVNQIVRGLKDEKTIRIGFVPFVAPKPGQPIIGGGRRPPSVEVGQDGLFMIGKHHEGKFYLPPNFGYFVSSTDKKFDEEVKTAKKVVIILADPKAALKSKDAEERLTAATLQVTAHRSQRFPGQAVQEPIDAEESKLIMDVILGSPWKQIRFGENSAQQLWFQLGIGPAEGFKAPTKITDVDEIRQAAQTWYNEHKDYRIKRFVPAAPK
jgi:hypothetical protein